MAGHRTIVGRRPPGDYPGDVATAHQALTPERASPTAERRSWGAFTPAGELVAATFTLPGAEVTETEFTVVHRTWRGRGLGSAVKVASVLALAAEGHSYFRTGGSNDNAASLAANRTVGYVVDEEWLTLIGPKDPPTFRGAPAVDGAGCTQAH